jgi:hypothetical protein
MLYLKKNIEDCQGELWRGVIRIQVEHYPLANSLAGYLFGIKVPSRALFCCCTMVQHVCRLEFLLAPRIARSHYASASLYCCGCFVSLGVFLSCDL